MKEQIHTHTEQEFNMVRQTVRIFCRGTAGRITDPAKIDKISYAVFKEICRNRCTGEAA